MAIYQMTIQLEKEEIKKFSSDYLQFGIRQDRWHIDNVIINDKKLTALVSMRSHYVSAQDALGFHLSSFTAQEFTAQLLIIYAHISQGYSEKASELWVVAGDIRCFRSIRSTSAIYVEMQICALRKRQKSMLSIADFTLSDDLGGLFKIKMKAILGAPVIERYHADLKHLELTVP